MNDRWTFASVAVRCSVVVVVVAPFLFCLLPLTFTARVFLTGFCRTSRSRALLCRPLLTCMTEICSTGGGGDSQRPCLAACPQGDSLKTSIQLDFGDGIKITYSNLSRTDDGIRHIYRATGIYRVTACAENEQGSDSSMLFLHITSKAPPLPLPAAAAIAGTFLGSV